MLRRVSAMALCLAISVGAGAHPALVPLDPPVALVQSDPGRTSFTLSFEASSWIATVSRSVSDAFDVAAVISPARPFDLRVRALIPWLPFPLRIAGEVGQDHVGVLGALHLGPMRLAGERSWGKESGVRIALHAATPVVAACVGADWRGDARPFVAATWFPPSPPLSSVTLTAAPGEWRLSIGGAW